MIRGLGKGRLCMGMVRMVIYMVRAAQASPDHGFCVSIVY